MYSPNPVPPRTNRSPNWFAAACGLAYLIVYLALPFYRVTLTAKTGMQLISSNALMVVPALMSVLMIIGSLVMPVIASISISSITLLITLVLMIGMRTFAISNPLVSGGLQWIGSQTNTDVTLYVVSIGYGAVICLALCIAAIVLEIVLNNTPSSPSSNGGGWVFDSRPTPPSGRGPSNPGGGYRPF